MKKRLCLYVAVLAIVTASISCTYGAYYLLFNEENVDSRATSACVLPLASDSTDTLPNLAGRAVYSFVIITDAHFGAARERRDSAFYALFSKQLNASDESKRPRFVVNLGDTLNAGKAGEADDYLRFCDELRARAAAAGVPELPIYTILGNHDLYNNGWEVWKDALYPFTSYYTFSLASGAAANDAAAPQGFSYYFLDSANGTLGKAQLDDVIARMEQDARPKLVFSHYAVYGGGIFYFTLQDTMERNLLISAFAKNNVRYVFAGHDHADHRYTFKDAFKEHVIASFLYKDVCALVTVDENTGAVTSENVEF